MDKHLHIVAFDIPYPVDHGGFFDLFHKLVSLHQQKIFIYLHCFEYGRKHQDELNKYCKKVFYYQRKKGLKGISINLPYIVASRTNNELIQNLSNDNNPILLEGTHCTYLLHKNYFPGRIILYRLHNIEHIYYRQLYFNEQNIIKKAYYFFESRLLQHYEKKVLPKASVVLTVSENDSKKIQTFSPSASVMYLPVFMPQKDVYSLTGAGNYCLYHGNLSVAENSRAATWLMEKVFSKLDTTLIIAGRKPPKSLLQKAEKKKTIQVVANPSEQEMQQLIQQAQINIILSLNDTGIKLKLLNALYGGRHCLANLPAVSHTNLEDLCHIANTETEIKSVILELQKKEFTQNEIELRSQKLHSIFNNERNAQKLITLLYSHYQ